MAYNTKWPRPYEVSFGHKPGMKELPEQMEWFNKNLNLSKYGDFDAPCKDFARISFFFKPNELLFEKCTVDDRVYKETLRGLLSTLALNVQNKKLF